MRADAERIRGEKEALQALYGPARPARPARPAPAPPPIHMHAFFIPRAPSPATRAPSEAGAGPDDRPDGPGDGRCRARVEAGRGTRPAARIRRERVCRRPRRWAVCVCV